MAKKPILIDLRDLTADESQVADALADYLVGQGVDLGDERSVAASLLAIPNENLPRHVAGRLFDHTIERARQKQQETTLGDLIGTAALFAFIFATSVFTLLPSEALAATADATDDWGLWPALLIVLVGAMSLFWSLRTVRDDRAEETETDRRYRRFEQ